MNAFSRAHPEHFWKDPREHNGTSVNIAYGSTPTGCTCSWGFWQGVGWEGRGKKISWKVPFYSVHRDGNMVVSILVKCPHLMATWLGALKNLSKFTSSETYESFVELIFFFFFYLWRFFGIESFHCSWPFPSSQDRRCCHWINYQHSFLCSDPMDSLFSLCWQPEKAPAKVAASDWPLHRQPH